MPVGRPDFSSLWVKVEQAIGEHSPAANQMIPRSGPERSSGRGLLRLPKPRLLSDTFGTCVSVSAGPRSRAETSHEPRP